MISFNANLKNNDGLLANHIAQSRKPLMIMQVLFSTVLNWKSIEANGSFSIKT
jgi:hypothetical protein